MAVNVEARVSPRKNSLGPFRAQQLLTDKLSQDLAGEDLLELRVVDPGGEMEDARPIRASLGHQEMQVGMEVDPPAEGLDEREYLMISSESVRKLSCKIFIYFIFRVEQKIYNIVGMVEPKRITKQECLNIASEINAGFTRYGAPIRPRSDISLLIKETLWLSENIDKSRNSLTDKDQRRFLDAVLRVEQAKNISTVFSQLDEIHIPYHKLIFLNKRLDHLNREGDSKAPDILFELEVAGRLARFKTFWNIQFAEPDIVMDFPGGRIGIACKRPKGIKRLSERIKEAAKQGNKSDLNFLIIAGVRDMITEESFLRFRTHDEFTKKVDDFLEILMNNCSAPINYAFEQGAGGVIFCDRFIAFIDKPYLSINWCLRHNYRANPRITGIDNVLTDFIIFMEK